MSNCLFILLLFQDISGGELMLVLLAIFLFFGPNRIPEISRKIGAGIAKIKRATDDIKSEVGNVTEPVKNNLKEGEKEPELLTDPKKKESSQKINPITPKPRKSTPEI